MFDQVKANAVCDLVAEGMSLRKAAEKIGVKAPTFLLWVAGSLELAEQYARARETGNDAEFEELQELHDMEPERGPSGSVDPGWVAWKRLQVDTRKWALSKKAPRKYGEKLDMNVGGTLKIERVERVIVGSKD